MAYVEISYRGYQVRNFITGQSQCTKVGGTLSEIVDLLSGVIQGSVLGPLFFSHFHQRTCWDFGITVKLFADDVKLYVKITQDVDLCVLQAAINVPWQWADAWQLSISVEKSSVLCVGKTVPITPMSINGASLLC